MIVFEDRVVQFPNRVKLSPVEGQPNVYDVSRQEGNVLKGGCVEVSVSTLKGRLHNGTAL